MGGSTSQKSTSTNTVNPAQMAQYQQNYTQAQGAAGILNPITGQPVTPGTPAAATAAANAPGAQPLSAATSASTGLLGFNPGSLATTDLTPYENPYTNDVINTTIADQDRSRQIANVGNDQAATAAGAFGGSRSGILDAQTNDAYDRNTGSMIANLNQANFTQAQGAAQNDIQTKLATGQLQLNAAGQLVNESGQAVSNASNLQGILNSALAITPTQQTVNSTGKSTTNPGLTGILSSLGSLGQGLGALGVNLSDERTKSDVRTLRHDARGRRWVSFRYNWEPVGTRHEGVIAQEVRATDPHAVIEGADGFLRVNYDMLKQAA